MTPEEKEDKESKSLMLEEIKRYDTVKLEDDKDEEEDFDEGSFWSTLSKEERDKYRKIIVVAKTKGTESAIRTIEDADTMFEMFRKTKEFFDQYDEEWHSDPYNHLNLMLLKNLETEVRKIRERLLLKKEKEKENKNK